MIIPDKFVYLVALIIPCLIWSFLFVRRKDLRKEIIFISCLIGILSVITSYSWWTVDWWRPLTITNTVVGIEDFIMGFTTGGIMSVIYNFIFRNKYKRGVVRCNSKEAYLLLILMGGLTAFLINVIGMTSFWSSTISMSLFIILILFFRKDLLLDSLFSGILMMLISFSFYLVIILISDTWVNNTYLYGLSGSRFLTIPIEEFIFWFLTGMWVGPFYEYCYGKKLK